MVFQLFKKILFFVASELHFYILVPLQKILSSVGLLRPLLPNQQGRRYACGILTSTSLEENYRHVLDFIALREMLDCPDKNSFWLCAEDFRSARGSAFPPASNRIPPKFEEAYEMETTTSTSIDDLDDFLGVYLQRVKKLAGRLTSDDTLYLVVSGHGTLRGCLLVGDDFDFIEGWPSSFKIVVEGCKADVHLVTSARLPGNWASPRWSFFSVAREERE
ncbi:hypothetical protein K443DRAFT_111728 [Laccaria amethystina LaAM-08-1]|uniref:Uncharacterized protein n=1 Tax=Laccaria amethystina LaAM-08-1 TaxID=1095629 RepID=A0A0C9WQW6_9AGAR|nr:hypothetical protein K443DRAFT_111728 [Laccaria amethystina LaAM-08-1]